MDITSLGTVARPLELGSPDHVLRIGWFAFGRIEDEFGEPRDYWREPIWIDFTHQLWTPVPQYTHLTGDFLIWAHQVRWQLSQGAEGFLEVGYY